MKRFINKLQKYGLSNVATYSLKTQSVRPIHSLTLYSPAKQLDDKNSSQTQSWAIMIDLPEDEPELQALQAHAVTIHSVQIHIYTPTPPSIPTHSLFLSSNLYSKMTCVFFDS